MNGSDIHPCIKQLQKINGVFQLVFEGTSDSDFKQAYFEATIIPANDKSDVWQVRFDEIIQHHQIIPGTGKFCILELSQKQNQKITIEEVAYLVVQNFCKNPVESTYPVDLSLVSLYQRDPVQYDAYIYGLTKLSMDLYNKHKISVKK